MISLAVFRMGFLLHDSIAFVLSLANLEGLERVAAFLRPVVEWSFVKSILQGFVPGFALKVFLYFLPVILMIMSIEGHVAVSVLERRTAAKYYYFMLVNVFLGSLVTGTTFQQLNAFLHQSAMQFLHHIHHD